MFDKKLAGHKFALFTEIKVNIKWETEAEDEEINSARVAFEKSVEEFASFLNQDLGNVILVSMEEVRKQKEQANAN